VRSNRNRIVLITAILLLEIVAIALVYQFAATVDCHETGAQGTCRFLRNMVARAIVAIPAFGLFFWARPDAWARLLAIAAPKGRTRWIWAAHLAGVGLVLLPAIIGGARNLTDVFHLALVTWTAGLLLAGISGMALFARLPALGNWLRGERYVPLIVLAVAALVPDVAELLWPVWDWQALTALTFAAVSMTLMAFAPDAQSFPETYILGAEGFFVHIARQCSGVEGIALMSVFVVIYGVLFRRDLRFPQYWLIVLPLGLVLSWVLNVLRIALLVLIGARISPELAVNGFHSFAGWFFFTALALLLLIFVQWLPWVSRRKPGGTGTRLRDDWLAARILPFVAFMVVGVVTSALWAVPDMGYPLKAVAILAALMFFRRQLSNIRLGLDPIALAAGLLVGLAWIWRQPPPGEAEAALVQGLSSLGASGLVFWLVARLLGTMLLVPIVEELFFRGYLLARLDFGGWAGRMFAIVASSGAFALLHGRLLDAFVAGVVFALVMLRRDRLGDAILAHVIANSAIAVWAMTGGDLSRL